MEIPTRSMLVEDARERILISPTGTAEEVRSIGRDLTTLVTPSLVHTRHLQRACDHLQPREVWGPPGLAAKLPALGQVLELGRDPWPHAPQLEVELVAGVGASTEAVFLHRPTRTLYVADLLFNIRRPHGLLAPVSLRAMGVYKKLAVPRAWRRRVVDRPSFLRSMDRILDWEFDRIAVAHGELVTEDARACLERALRERGLYD